MDHLHEGKIVKCFNQYNISLVLMRRASSEMKDSLLKSLVTGFLSQQDFQH